MLRVGRKGRHAGFRSVEALAELEQLLADRDHLVVLCLARPILNQSLRRRVVPIVSETAPEHYPEQYRQLLRAVEARGRAGRPTLILGGDVHEHSARLGLGGRVLELVSSPMSLIETLDGRGPDAHGLRSRPIEWETHGLDRVLAVLSRRESSWVSDGVTEVVQFSPEDKVRDGLATVRIDTSDPAEPVVTYTCHLSGLDEARTVTLRWRDQAWQS